MSYAVKYKTNKGEEEMKKRRVAKLIALSMVAATADRCRCTGKRGKSSYGNDIH